MNPKKIIGMGTKRPRGQDVAAVAHWDPEAHRGPWAGKRMGFAVTCENMGKEKGR